MKPSLILNVLIVLYNLKHSLEVQMKRCNRVVTIVLWMPFLTFLLDKSLENFPKIINLLINSFAEVSKTILTSFINAFGAC